MDRTFWHKQTPDTPLFPDLLWSRPENKRHAGKLLIVGGNAHGFSAAAEAYQAASDAGIGTARVLLPDSLHKTVSRVFPASEFAPSTPSGSFGVKALAELLDASAWADGTLLAGNLGRNSETAILLEKFTNKHDGVLAFAGDAVDYFIKSPVTPTQNQQLLLVLSFEQLQKLGTATRFDKAFTSSMDFLHLIDALNEFTKSRQLSLVINYQSTTFVAVNGQVSSTKADQQPSSIKVAAYASVWLLQNPQQPFKALTTSLI